MIKISDKEETLPSLRDRPWKLGNSGVLSVKYSPANTEMTGSSGDDPGLPPSVIRHGDVPAAEERNKSCEVLSVVA